jgi:hypothetical protein
VFACTAGAQLDGAVGLHGVVGVSCGEQGFDHAGGAGRLRRQAAGGRLGSSGTSTRVRRNSLGETSTGALAA